MQQKVKANSLVRDVRGKWYVVGYNEKERAYDWFDGRGPRPESINPVEGPHSVLFGNYKEAHA